MCRCVFGELPQNLSGRRKVAPAKFVRDRFIATMSATTVVASEISAPPDLSHWR